MPSSNSYYLKEWSVNGGAAQAASGNTLALTEIRRNTTVKAVFDGAINYDVTLDVQGATTGKTVAAAANGKAITPQKNSPASVTRGSRVVFTATPAVENGRNKQMVAQWTVNGVDQNNISNELVIPSLTGKTIEEALKLDQNEKEMIEHIIVQMEQERGLDRAAAIADMRFHFIHQLVDQTVVKPHQSKEQVRSSRIDQFLTGKYTAIPAFVGIMALVFYLTFGVIGAGLQNLLEIGIENLTVFVDNALTYWNVNEAVHSLVIDGIFTGVGSVLSFLPIIVTLFFFLSLLEDTGYMARVAFVMDKLLRRIGLSGRSIVPMLIGFGCTVPGVMASRTLPSERDRKMTILLTPFMSCSAKLPIYSLFAVTFFPDHAALVMVGLYFLGIAVGILAAFALKGTLFRGEAVPFVMELPNYRLPGLKNVMQLLWEKARDFLERAFTVIFMATIVIWFLQNFDLQLSLTADPQESILAFVASGIAPLFAPLGFADWRVSTALITGFMAKESVVSTLTILFGSSAALGAALSPAAAAPLLVFCLLYTPCIAAVASVKRELGGRWAAVMVLNQCVVAWAAAFIVRMLALALV